MINIYGMGPFHKKEFKTLSPQNSLKNPWTPTPAPRLCWRMLSIVPSSSFNMMHIIFDFEADWGFLVGADSPVGCTRWFSLSSASAQEQKTFLLATEAPILSGGLWKCIVLDWLHTYYVCSVGKEKHPQSSMLPIWQLTFIRNNSAKGRSRMQWWLETPSRGTCLFWKD